MVLRLTFNKPAATLMTEKVDLQGIEFTIIDDDVVFRPVADLRQGEDVALIKPRGTRGGIETEIGGEMEDTLTTALRRHNVTFFHVIPRAKNWFGISPYPTDEPSRTEPAMRVWFSDRAKPVSAQTLGHLQDLSFMRFVAEVRQAKRIVDEYAAQRRRGRYPKEVSEAEQKLRLLQQLASEIVPDDDLYRAYETAQKTSKLLEQYLSSRKRDDTENNSDDE